MEHLQFYDVINLEKVGKACRAWRIYCGIRLREVARDTGYSENNIWNFEKGKNNSAVILLWYMKHGFTYEYYLDYCDVYEVDEDGEEEIR